MSFFRFSVFTFGHQLGFGGFPGFRPEAFRFSFFVFIRFYSFLPFDAIWPARQGRLPCLGREGWRRHFAFDLHIEIIKIRPFGLKFCLRPAGTLSFSAFSFYFILIRFCHLTPFGRLPQISLRPARRPFVFRFFVVFRFNSFHFVYFRLFSFSKSAQNY